MEETDRVQRVWQRVRGEPPRQPEPWLEQLLTDQAAETNVWQQLGRRHGGIYARVAREKQAQLHCLRGIWRLAAGQLPPPKPADPEPPELRRSAARGMTLWRIFDDHSRDPEFGPVFQSLRDQQCAHCRVTLELLGRTARPAANGSC